MHRGTGEWEPAERKTTIGSSAKRTAGLKERQERSFSGICFGIFLSSFPHSLDINREGAYSWNY